MLSPGKDTSNTMKAITIILHWIPHGADLILVPMQSEPHWENMDKCVKYKPPVPKVKASISCDWNVVGPSVTPNMWCFYTLTNFSHSWFTQLSSQLLRALDVFTVIDFLLSLIESLHTHVLIIQCLVCVTLYRGKFTSIFSPVILIIFAVLRYKTKFCFTKKYPKSYC